MTIMLIGTVRVIPAGLLGLLLLLLRLVPLQFLLQQHDDDSELQHHLRSKGTICIDSFSTCCSRWVPPSGCCCCCCCRCCCCCCYRCLCCSIAPVTSVTDATVPLCCPWCRCRLCRLRPVVGALFTPQTSLKRRSGSMVFVRLQSYPVETSHSIPKIQCASIRRAHCILGHF